MCARSRMEDLQRFKYRGEPGRPGQGRAAEPNLPMAPFRSVVSTKHKRRAKLAVAAGGIVWIGQQQSERDLRGASLGGLTRFVRFEASLG